MWRVWFIFYFLCCFSFSPSSSLLQLYFSYSKPTNTTLIKLIFPNVLDSTLCLRSTLLFSRFAAMSFVGRWLNFFLHYPNIWSISFNPIINFVTKTPTRCSLSFWKGLIRFLKWRFWFFVLFALFNGVCWNWKYVILW